jgi:hypothetical protein
VRRYEQELPASFAPHPLFREEETGRHMAAGAGG